MSLSQLRVLARDGGVLSNPLSLDVVLSAASGDQIHGLYACLYRALHPFYGKPSSPSCVRPCDLDALDDAFSKLRKAKALATQSLPLSSSSSSAWTSGSSSAATAVSHVPSSLAVLKSARPSFSLSSLFLRLIFSPPPAYENLIKPRLMPLIEDNFWMLMRVTQRKVVELLDMDGLNRVVNDMPWRVAPLYALLTPLQINSLSCMLSRKRELFLQLVAGRSDEAPALLRSCSYLEIAHWAVLTAPDNVTELISLVSSASIYQLRALLPVLSCDQFSTILPVLPPLGLETVGRFARKGHFLGDLHTQVLDVDSAESVVATFDGAQAVVMLSLFSSDSARLASLPVTYGWPTVLKRNLFAGLSALPPEAVKDAIVSFRLPHYMVQTWLRRISQEAVSSFLSMWDDEELVWSTILAPSFGSRAEFESKLYMASFLQLLLAARAGPLKPTMFTMEAASAIPLLDRLELLLFTCEETRKIIVRSLPPNQLRQALVLLTDHTPYALTRSPISRPFMQPTILRLFVRYMIVAQLALLPRLDQAALLVIVPLISNAQIASLARELPVPKVEPLAKYCTPEQFALLVSSIPSRRRRSSLPPDVHVSLRNPVASAFYISDGQYSGWELAIAISLPDFWPAMREVLSELLPTHLYFVVPVLTRSQLAQLLDVIHTERFRAAALRMTGEQKSAFLSPLLASVQDCDSGLDAIDNELNRIATLLPNLSPDTDEGALAWPRVKAAFAAVVTKIHALIAKLHKVAATAPDLDGLEESLARANAAALRTAHLPSKPNNLGTLLEAVKGAFASADPHADDELPDSEPAYMVVGGQFGLTNASIKSFGLASFQELAVIGLATVGDLRANGISSDSDLLRFVRLPRSQALLGEHRRHLPPSSPAGGDGGLRPTSPPPPPPPPPSSRASVPFPQASFDPNT